MDEAILDRLSPEVFEKAITVLYRKMGFQVEQTPRTKDSGADVVAIPHDRDGPAFLIQCKHTIHPDKPQGPNGVQEILAARGVYSQSYQETFELVALTNARCFTPHACQIASANQVVIIDRIKLSDMFRQYQVSVSELSL